MVNNRNLVDAGFKAFSWNIINIHFYKAQAAPHT